MNSRTLIGIVAALMAATSPSLAWAQRITADALIARITESCIPRTDPCLAMLSAVNSQLSLLTRSDQAAFGARLAFLVMSNPALEPLVRAALLDFGNVVVTAGYNATNGESEDVVVPRLASPA